MQQMPLSASISAPASIANSPVSGSFTTDAVSPAADDALPEVYTARGMNWQVHLRNWDLAVDGSPTAHTLTSPRRWMPSAVRLCTPPMSISSTPRFTSSCPHTAGATDRAMRAYSEGVSFISRMRSRTARGRRSANCAASRSPSSPSGTSRTLAAPSVPPTRSAASVTPLTRKARR